MVAVFLLLKATPPAQPGLTLRQQLAKLDLLGEFFLFPSIICLLLALQWGGSKYAWSNWRIILLFIVFGLTFIGFVLVQIFMQETATIPTRVIKNRSIVSGMWWTICLSSAMMTLVYYIPIWFQAIKGKTAVGSGIATIPMVLAVVLGSISSGQLTARLGYYTPFAMASAVIMPIGAGLITTFDLHTSEGKWIGYQILLGFGIGLGMQQGQMASQTVLPRKDVPIGVSLIFFCQQLGGGIFVSVGQNAFSTSLISGLTGVLPDINPVSLVDNNGATSLRQTVPAQDLPTVLVAYNHALRQVFIVALCLACLASLGAFTLEFRSVKGKQGPTEKGSNESQNDSKPSTPEKAEA